MRLSILLFFGLALTLCMTPDATLAQRFENPGGEDPNDVAPTVGPNPPDDDATDGDPGADPGADPAGDDPTDGDPGADPGADPAGDDPTDGDPGADPGADPDGAGEQPGRRATPPSDGARTPGSTRGWAMCNKSGHPTIWVAVSVTEGGEWVTTGWHRIPSEHCVQLRGRAPEGHAYYYAYARGREWRGDTLFCINSSLRRFRHSGAVCRDGYDPVGFNRVEFDTSTVQQGIW